MRRFLVHVPIHLVMYPTDVLSCTPGELKGSFGPCCSRDCLPPTHSAHRVPSFALYHRVGPWRLHLPSSQDHQLSAAFDQKKAGDGRVGRHEKPASGGISSRHFYPPVAPGPTGQAHPELVALPPPFVSADRGWRLPADANLWGTSLPNISKSP